MVSPQRRRLKPNLAMLALLSFAPWKITPPSERGTDRGDRVCCAVPSAVLYRV